VFNWTRVGDSETGREQQSVYYNTRSRASRCSVRNGLQEAAVVRQELGLLARVVELARVAARRADGVRYTLPATLAQTLHERIAAGVGGVASPAVQANVYPGGRVVRREHVGAQALERGGGVVLTELHVVEHAAALIPLGWLSGPLILRCPGLLYCAVCI